MVEAAFPPTLRTFLAPVVCCKNKFARPFPPARPSSQTVMLLSLILSDKERRQEGGSGVEDIGEGREEQEQERDQRQDQDHDERQGGEGEEGRKLASSGGGSGKSLAICLDNDRHEKRDGEASDTDGSGGGHPGVVGSTGGDDAVAVVADALPRKRRLAPARDAALPTPSGGSIAATKRRRRSSSSAPSPSSTVPLDVSTSSNSNSSSGNDSSSGSGAESVFMPSPGKGHGTSTGSNSSSGSDGDDDGDSDSDFEIGAGAGKGKSRAAAAAPAWSSKRRRGGETGARAGNNSKSNGALRRDNGKKRAAADSGSSSRGGGRGKAGSGPSALLEEPDDVETLGVRVRGGGEEDGAGGGAGSDVVGRGTGRGRRAGRGDGGMRGGTLVVCPLSLIGQWRGELESKTRKGAISVCFHYGAGRSRCGAGGFVCVFYCLAWRVLRVDGDGDGFDAFGRAVVESRRLFRRFTCCVFFVVCLAACLHLHLNGRCGALPDTYLVAHRGRLCCLGLRCLERRPCSLSLSLSLLAFLRVVLGFSRLGLIHPDITHTSPTKKG